MKSQPALTSKTNNALTVAITVAILERRDNVMFVPPVGFRAPILPALAGRTVSRRLPICHLSKRVWRVANENSAGAHARQAGKLGSERAKEGTRNGKYTYVEYARFADDLVVLIDAHPRHVWLLGAVTRRLREKFAKL
ncbi:hypothetical protein [Paraburkholderia sp. RL18-085-BIA-A]|uniref:hypothetical protein n=1 Tax=Paraburkholderia sp. RL18-085-BIA-A TaxID=3031633 RepID=UPI0038BA9FB0